MDDIVGTKQGFPSPGQNRSGHSQEGYRPEVGPEPGEIPHILQGEDEQKVGSRLLHGIPGPLQAFPPHPAEIDPFFPINSHKSKF
jgi:hypothetical protein